MSIQPTNPTTVAIIGAGSVGATTAYALAIKNVVADIILIDVNEQVEEGQVMDIADSSSLIETGRIIQGSFSDAKNADIIVVTAGAPQKPGETRPDLVKKNYDILKSIFSKIGKIKESSIIILIANPVDVLTYATHQIVGITPERIFGTGTSLDTARLHAQVAKVCNVSAQTVQGFVLGEHGDTEFVAWSTVHIGGIPISQLPNFNARQKKEIEQIVKNEAYQIIQRTGATHFGIGMVTTNIIEAIIFDQRQILPLSTIAPKKYGGSCVSLSLPVILGRNGIEGHWPIKLDSEEKKKLQASAKVLGSYCATIT